MRGDGEGEPYIHAAGISFHGSVQKLFDTGKIHDCVESFFDFPAFHSENRPVQKDVFPSAELRMKSRPDFEQTCDAAPHDDSAFCRFRDAAEEFQQG